MNEKNNYFSFQQAAVSSGCFALFLLFLCVLGCAEDGSRDDGVFSRESGSTRVKIAPDETPVDNISGKVVGVSDGDTITVLDDAKHRRKIRLIGIDAPESGQPYGTAAKHNLSKMIFGKKVQVFITKKDRYGRELGTVYLDGADINLEQVKAGFAWHYKNYASEQSENDREKYSSAESAARSARLGLWRDENPVPPWEWRAHKR